MSEESTGAPVPNWQAEFRLRADIRQRDMYAYTIQLNELGGVNVQGASVLADHAVKAAIGAGWVETPTAEVLTDPKGRRRFHLAGVDIDDMHPGRVLWYGARVVQHYTKSLEIPPN